MVCFGAATNLRVLGATKRIMLEKKVWLEAAEGRKKEMNECSTLKFSGYFSPPFEKLMEMNGNRIRTCPFITRIKEASKPLPPSVFFLIKTPA